MFFNMGKKSSTTMKHYLLIGDSENWNIGFSKKIWGFAENTKGLWNTIAIDDSTLDYYGLELFDTQEASDHLPVVFDILISDDIGIDIEKILPDQVKVHYNYPNPFNSLTTISITLSSPGEVEISVYDLMGKYVNNLIKENKPNGHFSINWDGTDSKGQNATSGIYFYLLKVNKITYIRKMILLK